MLCKLWTVSALCAVALSAPALPSAPRGPVGTKVVDDYFNLLAGKVAVGKGLSQAPVCDLSKAVLPVTCKCFPSRALTQRQHHLTLHLIAPSPLPAVSDGLSLKHVAIGRGTQNYSCSTGNATAAPVALGAVATLYNSSCIASAYPDLLAALPNVALQFNLTSPTQPSLTPSSLLLSGHHFFSNATTPAFDMTISNVGFAPCAKNNSASAPPGASVGQNGVGLGAVTWLKLITRTGATGGLEEVYRVNTAGGSAPATCAGMPATFEVQYAAEYVLHPLHLPIHMLTRKRYWFYRSS